MKMGCITFRSITPAQRGQRVLRSRGLEVALQRTPRWMEERGCGYCLKLQPEQIRQAAQLLHESGLAYSKIYVEEDGTVTEWTL